MIRVVLVTFLMLVSYGCDRSSISENTSKYKCGNKVVHFSDYRNREVILIKSHILGVRIAKRSARVYIDSSDYYFSVSVSTGEKLAQCINS